MRAALFALAMMAAPLAAAEFGSLDGHGGPVMAVAVRGERVLTGSFDYSVGLWAGADGPRFLEGHRAAVNAVAFVGADRAVSGGDDFDLILWDLDTGAGLRRMRGHKGKVRGVAATADGATIASASWDGTIGLWDGDGTAKGFLDGGDGGVNAVSVSQDGARLWSASQGGTLQEWRLADRTPARLLDRHGFGINVLAVDEAADWIAYGAVDGATRVLRLSDDVVLADLTAGRRPILALARSPDGSRLAVGDGEGYIMVVATATWTVETDFRAAANGPVWALAFTADGTGLIAGGIDDRAYLWPVNPGASEPRMATTRRGFHTDPAAVDNGERQFLRKCSVCHSLDADGRHRAGPPLAGLFGRKAGSYPGYGYSPALAQSDIVWNADTIDRLFDLGPAHVTPGSKMPMQRIARPGDRADLIAFLQRQTAD